ncbi:MAG: hypothetical protein O7A98_10550, partial [Acidobacteria bacterium]|nr:hypothetical protein [Acidobacteriota bacterium]
YLAKDNKLGRQVALKVLPPDMSSDPERLERFQRPQRSYERMTGAYFLRVPALPHEELLQALRNYGRLEE